ncbi:MAG TPA: hydroxyisourate hydrolase, partial [Terriglobales bacterium]|nr:hydroxyisourate hydrolase [Terriglobales bacterium]
MNRISTHVLDLARGKPAQNVKVSLDGRDASGEWKLIAVSHTDIDGRCAQLLPDGAALEPGVYRLNFDTAAYQHAQNTQSLYPAIDVIFQVRKGEAQFHLPLLLSPNGYTTYRGS